MSWEIFYTIQCMWCLSMWLCSRAPGSWVSPVRLAGGSDLADSVAAPAQDRGNGPDEGEGPDKQQAQHGMLPPQSYVPEGTTDHEEALKRQDGQGPHSNNP